jgi:hypothetical protein
MDDLFTTIDLDADRARRAAEREAKGSPGAGMPIILGGETVAVLPPEVPVDAFASLRMLDADISLIIRQSMEAARGSGTAQDTTNLVIDLLSQNPNLPTNALDIIRDVAKGVIGEEGVNNFMAKRPSPQDIATLVKFIIRFYGVTLGESSPSSDSSTDEARTDGADGGTSNGTSSTTSTSTSEASTDAPAIPASSVPVGS